MTKEKKSTKKRLRIRPLTVIVALLALLYITLSVIPLNLTPWKDDISKAASSGINGTITMDEVWIYLAPHPRVKIINLTLKDEKEVILNAKNMRVTVSLFPLILKKLNIRELIFENLELRARRDTKGIINFQRLSKKKTFTLKLSSLQLKNSKIDFFDDMAGGGKHHEVSNANAFFDVSADGLKYQSSGKILPKTSFQISGSAVKDNNFWSLTGNLNLDNLEVGRFTPYLKAVKIKDAKTTGTLTLKTEYNFTGKNPSGNKNFLEAVLSGEGQVKGHATSKDFVLKMPSLFSKEINSANANTDLELTWKDKEVFFALKDTTLEIENHTINGTLTMESSEKAQASFELNLKTTPIKASYIKDLIRPKALPSGFKKIVEIRKPVTGIVIIKKLSFGTGGGVLNTLSLDARLSDFSFSNPNLKQPVTGISGRLSAHGGNLYVNNLRGKYGSSKVENISGEIRNVSKSPFYSATLKATLDTGEAFDEFRKRFKSKTLRGALISGKADVELSIKGGGEDDAPFLITSSLDITGSEFFYKKSLRKTNGQVLRLKSKLLIDKGNPELKGESRLFLGTSVLDIKASISKKPTKERHSYTINLSSDELNFKDLTPLSPYFEAHKSNGSLEVKLTSKRIDGEEVPNHSGTVRINEGEFKSTFFAKPVSKLNGIIRLRGKGGKVILENMNIGDSKLSGKIDIVNISKKIINFNLLSKELNLSDIFATKKDKEREEEKKESPKTVSSVEKKFMDEMEVISKKQRFTGQGVITIKKGTLNKTSFQNLRAEIEIKKDHINLTPLSLTMHNGQVAGSATFFRNKTAPLLFKTKLSADRIELKTLIKELGAKKDILTGRLTARLDLSAKRGQKSFNSGLEGEVLLTARGGKLWKFVVVSKIFSVINIISITELFELGFPYKHISGSLQISDGLIQTKDLVLSGKTMRITTIGKLAMENWNIKLTVGLHPLVTIDKIISRIPIAGWVLTGDKGTLNMYYRIKGPISKPQVKPQTAKGMSKDVRGIFERLLTLPLKLIEPFTKEKNKIN